ncbi:MAG: YihY/virulence factor BrkB family protein [Saprospiraceae bacterium]|nr:YihY/virulence factor BrkB family protein [Saprospiraceae bacterium]
MRAIRKVISKVRGRIRNFASQHTLPGFQGVSIYEVFVFLRKEIQDFDLIIRSQSMAFSFFLALFPAIIVLFTLVPFLPIENFEEVLQRGIESLMPESAHRFVFETVNAIRERQRGVGLLSIGFILSLFFASNGMVSMIRGFEKSYESTFRTRNFLEKRAVAIGLTVLLSLLLLVSVASMVFGNRLVAYVLDLTHHHEWQVYAVQLLKWVLVIGVFYLIFATVYRFGPAIKDKLNFFTAGASLATVLAIIVSIAFSYVMDNFGNQSSLYGSLGAIIVTMLWMQINCFIILVGFELNASIAVNRDRKKDTSAIRTA